MNELGYDKNELKAFNMSATKQAADQPEVHDAKPRKSRRIDIHEFGYDDQTLNKARKSISSLSPMPIRSK